MSTARSFAPLRHQVFRHIWLASLLSNFGLLINGVAAGWAMTELSGQADLVALVQTALMLPFMLFSLVAGAISDTYDRRRVSMAMLGFALASSVLLTGVAWAGWLTPGLLLVLCFLNGTANAMFGPAWQASVSEQVPPEDLGPAVALNSVSYNIARSFGPALGGLIVAVAGAVTAFGTTALCYLPILLALYLWRREQVPPRLPPERIGWAIVSGVRYVVHSPPMRAVILRALLTGLAGGSISSLMPLVARDLIGGSAAIYGLLLGVFGIGAVLGALVMPVLQSRLRGEWHVGGSTALLGLTIIALSLSRSLWVAMPVLFLAGIMWMQPLTQFNIIIQTAAPRWVAGRALAAFQAAIAGGLAGGAWLWGHIGTVVGTAPAIAMSGLAMVGCVLASRIWPLEQEASDTAIRDRPLATPDVRLALTGRSGPIVVEVEYRVEPERAMLAVQRFRQRNGASLWTLARDIADESCWIERFSCPTWHDYLRQRERMTAGELAIFDLALAETMDGRGDRVRRLLERPVGSVRWRSESRDPGLVLPMNPGSG